jgi:hypothetical protein
MESESANVTPTEETTSNEVESSQSETTGQETKSAEGAKAAQAARELGEQDLDAIVTVKINGEVKKMPVREVIKLNQLENVSQAKMKEAAKLVKQVEQFFSNVKKDPEYVLREAGIDPDEWAEATLAKKFELMQMSPEQKELMEYKNKLKTYEEKEKAEKEAKEFEEKSRAEAQVSEALDLEIGEAWKEAGLPKSKKVFADIAFKMLSASRQGKNLTAKEAAASVKTEFLNSITELVSQMDAEAIQGLLGKEVMKKLRAWDVKRVTGQSASSEKQSPVAKTASTAQTFKHEHDWRKALDERFANLKD